MIRIKFSFFILYLTCISSCISTNSDEIIRTFDYQDFRQKVELDGRSFMIDSIEKPVNITIISERNLLLVLGGVEQPYLAAAFTLDSVKFIKQFVKKGLGDNEQLIAYSLRVNQDLSTIFISDVIKNTIFEYSIDSIVVPKSNCAPVSIRKLSNSHSLSLALRRPIVLSKKGGFVDLNSSTDSVGSGHLNFFNSSGMLIKSRGIYPVLDPASPRLLLQTIYDGGINQGVDDGRLTLTYFNFDIIDIYDSAGNLTDRVQGPDNIRPKYKSKEVGGGFMPASEKKSRMTYMTQSRMNHDKLFALYSGKEIRPNNYHCTELLQFTDHLIPQVRYQLRQPIFDFDIDWKTKTIYGLSHEGHNKIIIFKI